MRKRTKIIIAIGLMLLLVSGFVSKDAIDDMHLQENDIILSYLKETNAEVEEIFLSGWSILNRKFMDEASLNSKLDKLVEALELNRGNLTRKVEAYEDMSKGILNVTDDKAEYTINIESFRNENKDEKTYCSVTIKYSRLFEDNIMKEKNSIEKAFAKVDFPIDLYVSVIGKYQGKLEDDEIHDIISRLLDAVDGYKVEEINNNEFTSISFYTDKIDDFVYSKGKRINLQVAIRYSHYYDSTYICIGSPLISFEY